MNDKAPSEGVYTSGSIDGSVVAGGTHLGSLVASPITYDTKSVLLLCRKGAIRSCETTTRHFFVSGRIDKALLDLPRDPVQTMKNDA